MFCFLSLGVLIPFFHCRGPCSQKSHLVSFCAPVFFSSPLLSTCHFCSFTLYLFSLPILSFLNHFIPFLRHPNQHHFESHISFLHKIEAPSLKSPKVATTSTIFLSNPYSAVLFLALVFSSHHASVTTPSLSLFISLSPPPLHFSPLSFHYSAPQFFSYFPASSLLQAQLSPPPFPGESNSLFLLPGMEITHPCIPKHWMPEAG